MKGSTRFAVAAVLAKGVPAFVELSNCSIPCKLSFIKESVELDTMEELSVPDDDGDAETWSMYWEYDGEQSSAIASEKVRLKVDASTNAVV